MLNQLNLIKVYSKIDTLIKSVQSNFEKIGYVLTHQINLMENSQPKFKLAHAKKNLQKSLYWQFATLNVELATWKNNRE